MDITLYSVSVPLIWGSSLAILVQMNVNSVQFLNMFEFADTHI